MPTSPDPERWPAALIAEWVSASCSAQGLPVKVTDALVLQQVQVLLKPGPA